ncbi:MAG: PEGA domain-containing protein [Terracidiphilus sp.]
MCFGKNKSKCPDRAEQWALEEGAESHLRPLQPPEQIFSDAPQSFTILPSQDGRFQFIAAALAWQPLDLSACCPAGGIMSTRLGFALLFASLLAPQLHAQSWYYSGTKSCIDFGTGFSQCFSQGFVNQMSDSRPRSYEDVHRAFQEGQQAGEGFGSLVGTLIGLWIQHHQAVKAETNDLRAQLIAYHRAQDEVFDNQLQMEAEDERLCVELSRLDPARADHWKQGAENAREMQSKMASIKGQMQQVEAMELKVTSPKALRQVIDDPQHGVKWRLDYQQKWAEQVYVIHQFLVAREGMYSAQPSEPPSSPTPPLATSSAPAAQGATATLTVERSAANAEIYLDGAFEGNTPSVLHVPSGNHVVRLTAGKDTWERTLAVSDGADLRLRPAF